MSDENRREIGADENYIPTGLPGGFFIYNAGIPMRYSLPRKTS